MDGKMIVLAIDLGASSGRGIIIDSSNGLALKEVHRFNNEPVSVNGTFRWDILRIYKEILLAIKKATLVAKIDSLSIDTWGVDYGLIDKSGQLIGNPYHYRDSRTQGIIDSFDLYSKEDLYKIAGISLNEFNTTYQLYKESHINDYANTKSLLFIPNLLTYFLTGVMATEPTIASTSGFYKQDGGFDKDYLQAINMQYDVMPKVMPTGTVIGKLLNSIVEEMGLDYNINVVLGAGHDTACAVASVPSTNDNVLYLSSGTWSLFGTLLDEPIVSNTAYKNGYTNELGVQGVRFLKNIMGLWIIQEVKRDLEKSKQNISFAELATLAEQAQPFKAFINVNDSYFNAPNNMIARIKEYVKKTQNIQLDSIGDVARTVFCSLAMEYKKALDDLKEITKKKYTLLNIIGGGAQNILLNQMTANALGIDVKAGPFEATAIGNALVQFKALGEIKSYEEGVQLVINAKMTYDYSPQATEQYNNNYNRYLALKKA